MKRYRLNLFIDHQEDYFYKYSPSCYNLNYVMKTGHPHATENVYMEDV